MFTLPCCSWFFNERNVLIMSFTFLDSTGSRAPVVSSVKSVLRALSSTSPELQVKAFPPSLPSPGAVRRGEEEAVRCLWRGGPEGWAPELPRRHLLPVRRFYPFGLSCSCCSVSVVLEHPFDGVFTWPRVADVRVETEGIHLQWVSHMQFPVVVFSTPCCKQEPGEHSHMGSSGLCG